MFNVNDIVQVIAGPLVGMVATVIENHETGVSVKHPDNTVTFHAMNEVQMAFPAQQPEFTVNANGGKKQTGNKPQYNQVPEAFVAALTQHMTIGALKYGFGNWCKGMTESQILEADRRHSAKRRAGENTDPETGSSHYLAKAANAMMGWCLEQQGKLEDDRAAVYIDIPLASKDGGK